VDVSAVAGRRDLKAFIDLPFRLHATSPVWIPPLKLDQRMLLSRRFSAFFKHGEAEYFLARRDGRVVGRITAQIDRAFNDYQENDWGWFGFVEFEDDPEVVTALLDAAAAWLQARGRDRMVGPACFTMNDEAGVLIEGFEREPFIRQPWHPPYYQQRLEEAGMAKAVDLYMWELYIQGRDKVDPGLWELAEQVESKHGIVLRKMSRRSLRKDFDTFAEIYNKAWRRNWGFVPFSKEDLDAYAQEMQLVFDKHWFMVAERKDTGEAVGAAITVPDVNQVLKKMHGRLLPFGWLTYLRKNRHIDRVRVGFLGVKPEYQHTGVAAKLYQEHFDMAEVRPQTWGEMGWILETNRAMNRGMEAMGGKIVKKYRVYERDLGAVPKT
jgi:ribosomal protein S18 acetylase RimI-like enzyme